MMLEILILEKGTAGKESNREGCEEWNGISVPGETTFHSPDGRSGLSSANGGGYSGHGRGG